MSQRSNLDAALVAPWHPVARQAFEACLEDGWADPRRIHHEGRKARQLLDAARESMAECLGARADELTWAHDLASAQQATILGLRYAAWPGRPVTVASAVEQGPILKTAEHSLPSQPAPAQVRYLSVDADARVIPEGLSESLAAGDVGCAVIQAANAEVGAIQPLKELRALTRAATVPVAVDSTGWLGHHPEPLTEWDALIVNPASWGAPGSAVFAVRTGTRWRSPYPMADSLERHGFPANIPAAVAAAASLREINRDLKAQAQRRAGFVEQVRQAASGVPGVSVVGPVEGRLPHVLTCCFEGIEGEAIVEEFNRRGFAIGSGSACTTSTLHPSHVLQAMGAPDQGNVRIGLPAGVSQAQIDAFIAALPLAVAAVRERFSSVL